MSPGFPGTPGQGQYQDKAVPDYCLVRILDATVKPGESYKYRVRVKMTNPNYATDPKKRTDIAYPKLAEAEELKSEWSEIPTTVRVPPDVLYYAVDEKHEEEKENAGKKGSERVKYKGQNHEGTPERGRQLVFQIHQWFDSFTNKSKSKEAVGDWLLAERVFVNRGEYFEREQKVEVPVKPINVENFELAQVPGAGLSKQQKTQVPILFGDKSVLLDFETAEVVYKRGAPGKDGEPARPGQDIKDRPTNEVLILAEDGRVLAHDADTDAADKAREARHKEWRQWVEAVKKGVTEKKMEPGKFGP